MRTSTPCNLNSGTHAHALEVVHRVHKWDSYVLLEALPEAKAILHHERGACFPMETIRLGMQTGLQRWTDTGVVHEMA